MSFGESKVGAVEGYFYKEGKEAAGSSEFVASG